VLSVWEALKRGTEELKEISPTPELDARVLLGHVTARSHLELIVDRTRLLSPSELEDYLACLARRKKHEPVAYIVNRREFMGLDFYVDGRVLIPRPDTETLVEAVLERSKGWIRPRILDLGCGSGAVGLALAHYHPESVVTLADRSRGALEVARKNALDLGLEVAIIESDLFEGIRGEYEVVVSNPPYIDSGAYETLSPSVKDFEPREALWAPNKGLAYYERILLKAREHLAPRGLLALETGHDQKDPVVALLKAGGYHEIEVIRDLGGHHRVVLGLRGE